MTTDDCKNKITSHLRGLGIPQFDPILDPKYWKRTSKRNSGSYVVRAFKYENPGTGIAANQGNGEVYILEKNNHLLFLGKSQLDDLLAMESNSNESTEALLIAQAKLIKHCGDYGFTYYNDKTKSVIWCGGDGDGDTEEGHTSFDEIRRMFRSVPGILDVEIADEWGPEESEDADDWKNLGRHGIEVYWSYTSDKDGTRPQKLVEEPITD